MSLPRFLATSLLLSVSALAHADGTPATPAASTLAYQAANAHMHQGMAIAFTGDADYDFIVGMIPHHQGAIDMAKIVLEHGQSERVKKLAQDIIAAQEAEIAQMRTWQAEIEAAQPELKAAATANPAAESAHAGHH